jgi:YidC/Oxa1 family membrane protein insertase
MVVDPMFLFGADEASASMMQAAVNHVHELILSSSSSLLSDAATATADAATSSTSSGGLDLLSALEAPEPANGVATDGGWWQSYLKIYKTTLVLVHETIDPVLTKMGVEHTWGISIALFTASKFTQTRANTRQIYNGLGFLYWTSWRAIYDMSIFGRFLIVIFVFLVMQHACSHAKTHVSKSLVGVRALLVPLSIQQSKSSEYMKALKPYMNEIKEKFKDNKDMQNRATAKLMEDANQNPLAGCFVSILQIPVFLGLYRGVRLLAQEGRLQEPFLWIPSLEGPVSPPDYRGMDWLTQGWTQDVDEAFAHPSLGWQTTLAFLVMPVVLVVMQSITMRVLQPPMDDNMSKEEKETMEKSMGLLKFLPLMIGFFSLQVPAGLTIYWFTSNIFTLSQSLGVRSYYKANPPKIELPDYWDALDDVAKMSAEDRRKAAEAGIATGPNFEDLMDGTCDI